MNGGEGLIFVLPLYCLNRWRRWGWALFLLQEWWGARLVFSQCQEVMSLGRIVHFNNRCRGRFVCRFLAGMWLVEVLASFKLYFCFLLIPFSEIWHMTGSESEAVLLSHAYLNIANRVGISRRAHSYLFVHEWKKEVSWFPESLAFCLHPSVMLSGWHLGWIKCHVYNILLVLNMTLVCSVTLLTLFWLIYIYNLTCDGQCLLQTWSSTRGLRSLRFCAVS